MSSIGPSVTESGFEGEETLTSPLMRDYQSNLKECFKTATCFFNENSLPVFILILTFIIKKANNTEKFHGSYDMKFGKTLGLH